MAAKKKPDIKAVIAAKKHGGFISKADWQAICEATGGKTPSGHTTCEKCHGAHAARANECPGCGYIRRRSGQVSRPSHSKASAAGLDERTMFFALQLGGISQAKSALENLRTDTTVEYAIQCGGISEAIAALETLEERLAQSLKTSSAKVKK